MERRRLLLAWLPFVLGAAIPAIAVGAIAWRARTAAIVEAQRDGDVRVSEIATAAKGELDGRLTDARRLVRALDAHDEPNVASPPSGADAVVLDANGELAYPAPPRPDVPTTPACARARDDLLGPGRAAARDLILANCTDVKGASDHYLWPLLALETANATTLPEWLTAHVDRLSDGERDVLRRRAGTLGGADRSRVLAALDAPPSHHVTLRGLLGARRDDTVDGVLRVHEGAYVSILRVTDSGRTGGVVFYRQSILRAPPALPADLELASGGGAGPGAANIAVTPELVFHLVATDGAAQRASVTRAGNVLFGVAITSVLASLVLAAILYARFLGARRLAQLRTDFVAAVSHELRTPLASVQMLAELLEQGAVPEDERPEVEKTLAVETRRLSDTLSRMLRFGALARGKLSAERKRTLLAPIAQAVAARFRAAHLELAVEVSVDEGLEADVDGGLLALALDNLLGNAAKYAPAGGPYRLELTRSERKVRISVQDSGPGLDRRAQARVFLPFERADDRLSRATEGTGVGLSLVRGIARAHDGEARVESAPGEGATFILEIPWKPS